MTYYFTYGMDGQPYHGGWTEIVAPDEETAVGLFRGLHPDKCDGIINCCSVLSDPEFLKTSMWMHGNFGHRAWEKVSYWKEKR